VTDNKNPFITGSAWGHKIQAFDAQSRLDMIKHFDREQLQAVVTMPGVQKTVKQAAERKLRKLEKQ
jgi:hypothetical protein